jgi:hypothetical protein
MRHRLLAPLVALPVALTLVLAPLAAPAPRPVMAAPQARADIIRAAYTLVMDHFYRVPAPDDLLRAAWTGASRALIAAGVPEPLPEPPELPSDRDGA